ncbi:DUF4097 family beta strand repeat-containing protein [Streptomyces varsoviensis]|uniref:DUF4097 family beta strand repeat-containing protein n=1 Tax=Streptomyces varsoviensis TaxID=67373 RepID=UPI0033E9ADA0
MNNLETTVAARTRPHPRRTRPAARTAAVRTSFVAAAVLVAGVAVAGCGGGDASDAEPEYKSFAVKGKELTVDSDNSEVEVVTADKKGAKDGKEVKVTRWFKGKSIGGSAKADWQVNGDTLKLRVHCSGISATCSAKHKVEVPAGVAVTVKSDNGPVRADGIAAALHLTAHSGAITVRDPGGPLDISTTNGAVKATGVTSSQVKTETSNGPVHLALTRVPDRVDATTSNGPVDIELPRSPYKLDVKTKNGSQSLDVPRDDASKHVVSVHTSNGPVKVGTAN